MRGRFQQWLKSHYGPLANLNSRWSATYWSQTQIDWSQITIGTAPGNPGLLLSWIGTHGH
jgi:beta-galactosidase GanA